MSQFKEKYLAKDSIGQRGRKQRLRNLFRKKVLSDEKDLSLTLRGNTEESGKRSKILEEARRCGEASHRQEGATPSTKSGRELKIS